MKTKIISIFFCLLLITTFISGIITDTAVKADPIEGLIGYWSFDEGTGSVAYDSSGCGNDGVIIGATWTTGKRGSALEITHTEYVGNIPAKYDDTITNAFTVVAWVKWYGLPSYNHGSYFFDGRGNPYLGEGFLLYISFQSTVGFWLNDVDMSSNIFSNYVVPIDSWVHVAAVYNDSSDLSCIYINGHLDNTKTITETYTKSNHYPAIGTNHWAPGDGQWAPINGVEDEVRLYNRALNASEILALYDSNATDISIDIKPGDYPNTINPKSQGKVPVAILTTEDFDASEVNPDSIDFLSAAPVLWAMEDVDSDNDSDMILHFNIPELDFTLLMDEGGEYPYAYLYGQTVNGTAIEGKDTVRLLGKLLRDLW
ncbi:MAG: LamG domain-containing protein, partial [Candidatus Thermoplasmatota archaeon]